MDGYRVQVVIPMETRVQILKEADRTGMPFSEIVRFVLNNHFNPRWIELEKRFYKQLDENVSPTSRGSSGKKS